MSENFVAICAVCKKPIPSEQLKYAHGKEFHTECFEQHGSEFAQVDSDLLAEMAKIRVELTELKNLKNRLESGKKKSRSKTKKRKSKRRVSRRKVRKSSRKRKVRR